MAKRVLVIGGDGIGPEVTAVAQDIVANLVPEIVWERALAGLGCFHEQGTSLPADTVARARAADAVLFGAVTTPPALAGYKSAILGLRQALQLYANVRPARSAPVPESRAGIDMVIVRENTEGLYSGIEREEPGRAVTERVITEAASSRIVTYAFDLARKQGRPKVTIVHKANVLRLTCGLFRRVAFEVAERYPGIAVDEMLVDTCAMRLVTHPEHFSVIVTTNLFGDILSDVAAALVGGIGLAASANIGRQGALFEPVHGSAPDIAGTGSANPCAALRSAALMLDYLGYRDAGTRLAAAVDDVLLSGPWTPDLRGQAGTTDVAAAVRARLATSPQAAA